MQTIAVLATGGTIASCIDANGTALAQVSGEELVARLDTSAGVRLQVDDVFRIGSYLMTLPLMHELAERIGQHLSDPLVSGVVVTHGTDTTEETAFFLDLVIGDERPIVLTGAQQPADASNGDGSRNLADAVTVAASPDSRGYGTLVVFDGHIFAARGVRKSQTVALDAFSAPPSGPVGRVHGEKVQMEADPRPRSHVSLRDLDLGDVRVDIAPIYPGADAAALRAFDAAGARGIVVEGTGAGNANPVVCAAVAELSRSGVVVAISTRVEAGPVKPLYGNGGGRDLEAAGAVPTGLLRPSQARILLAVLLGAHRDPGVVRAQLASHAAGAQCAR